MKIFQKGITSFGSGADSPSNTDTAKLKTLAHSIKIATHYELIHWQTPTFSNNFFQLRFKNKRTSEYLKLLFNGHYPYFCRVDEAQSSWMNLKFIKVEEEFQEYFEPDFRFLLPEFLNGKFTQTDLEVLWESEKKQIAYWNSTTFGEVIFNGYD